MSMNDTLAAAFANIEKWEQEQADDSSAAAPGQHAIVGAGHRSPPRR